MAFEAYIKFDGVDGESKDDGHEKWIRLTSFSLGVAQTGGGLVSGVTGPVGGEAVFSDFSFSKELDAASPELWLFCANGHEFKKVEIEVVSTAGTKTHKYLKYLFELATLSGIHISSGGDRPQESGTFRFKKAKWTYTPWEDDQEGAEIERGWDLQTGKSK